MNEKMIDSLGSVSQEALDHFIYVIGMARGGTSVFRDALAIHDHLLVLPGMTHFMNQVWRYRNKVHLRLLKQIFRLPTFYRETEVIRDLDEEKRMLLQETIDKALSSGDLKWMWQIYPLVYGLDEENKKNPREIRGWADKANDFYKINRVRRSFPKGKFILLVRDPRAGVSSLAKRLAVKEQYTFDAAIDDANLIEACITWRNMTQKMAYFAGRHPERAKLVRVEDFFREPAKALNEIFRFLWNAPMPENLINERLGEVVYGASNVPGETGMGISKEPIERWKKVLNEREVEIVETLTEKTAKKVGYEMPGFRSGRNPFAIIHSIPSLKRKALAAVKFSYLQLFETAIRAQSSETRT